MHYGGESLSQPRTTAGLCAPTVDPNEREKLLKLVHSASCTLPSTRDTLATFWSNTTLQSSQGEAICLTTQLRNVIRHSGSWLRKQSPLCQCLPLLHKGGVQRVIDLSVNQRLTRRGLWHENIDRNVPYINMHPLIKLMTKRSTRSHAIQSR